MSFVLAGLWEALAWHRATTSKLDTPAQLLPQVVPLAQDRPG